MSVIERALSSASDYRLNMRMSMRVKGSGMGVEASVAGAVGGPFNAAMNQMNNAAQQYLAASKGYQFTAIQPIAVKVAEQMLRVGVTAPGAMTKRMQKMRLWRKSFSGDEARLLGVDCEPYRHELLFKSAPLHIKHKRQDIEIIEDHVALAAYNDPNPYMSQWALMYCTAFSIKAVGEAVWVLDPQPDGLLHIWYMPRSWCTPVHTEGNLFTGWKIQPPGTTEDVKPIPSSLVCHFQLPNPGNPMLSQSALSAQALAINTDDEIQRSQYHLVRNMQRPSMLITLGELTDPSGKKAGRPELTDKQRQAMVQSVRRHYQDATKFGDPMVLDAIVDNVQPYLPNLADLDYKDGSKLTKDRIQQGIGTNPFIVGESPGTNRASAWVARELHNDMQVNPILTLCGQELGRKLPVVTNDPHLVVWFDHARAKDPDLVNRRMQTVITAGAVTKGEAREWAETGEVELLPRDDDDELLKGKSEAPPAGQPNGQPAGQQPGQEGDEPVDPEDVEKGFDPYTMMEAIEYGKSIGELVAKNCGTGAGGFKPGKACATGGGRASGGGGAGGGEGESKSDIAKRAHVMVDAAIQRYSEETNEPQLAKGVGGKSLADNEPVDVVTTINGKKHGIELKTMTVGKNDKLTMKKSAMDRKRSWERRNKGVTHTVVFDDRDVFNAKGKGKHDLSKRKIYYRRGYGSFRVGGMLEVSSMKELKSLLTKTRRQLPKSAGGTLKEAA